MLALFFREHADQTFATCSSRECPIAHYVITVFPDSRVLVTSRFLRVVRVIAGHEMEECEKHSDWLRDFIRRLDWYGAKLRTGSELTDIPAAISGAKALEILEHVPE